MQGIDLSQDMVDQLRAKPGGDFIDVAVGDFATTTLDRTFRQRLPPSETVRPFSVTATHLGFDEFGRSATSGLPNLT